MVTDKDILKAEKAAKISIFFIIFGVIIVLASILYAAYSIKNLKAEISQLNAVRSDLENQIKERNINKEELDKKINNLSTTQKSMFDFLASISKANNIKFIGKDIDWDKVQENLIYMKPGKRKEALFGAIILSSVGFKFKLGETSVQRGFDSSTFIQHVLSQVGVNIQKQPNRFLSVTIMEQCTKVEAPTPGDLIFFRGDIGNYGVFYLSKGNGPGIGIGAIESSDPCVIVDTHRSPRFLGYFRVHYPDEG